jgi:hypothetical protein
MALPNIFSSEVSDEVIGRIGKLTPETQRLWGKMDVAQMLAHLCVTYEMVYEPERHTKPGFLTRTVLKLVAKRIVTNEKPYGKNKPTAAPFKIVSEKDFESEKTRLIDYIRRTQTLGEAEFEGRESMSFGNMTATEWNNMMYKHLNHHLEQFGV